MIYIKELPGLQNLLLIIYPPDPISAVNNFLSLCQVNNKGWTIYSLLPKENSSFEIFFILLKNEGFPSIKYIMGAYFYAAII